MFTCFLDLKTNKKFSTNYIDHYGGVVYGPRGLTKFEEVKQIHTTLKQLQYAKSILHN